MRKDQRITKTESFAVVRSEGKSWSDKFLVLIARSNGVTLSRFGFSVGRRVGGAVIRNKVKRRLREAARQAQVQNGWDMVVIVRKKGSSADFHMLRRSMNNLMKRAGVLDVSPNCSNPSPKID